MNRMPIKSIFITSAPVAIFDRNIVCSQVEKMHEGGLLHGKRLTCICDHPGLIIMDLCSLVSLEEAVTEQDI